MVKILNTPGGPVSFPDDMSDATIEQELARHFGNGSAVPPPAPTVPEAVPTGPRRELAIAGSNALGGAFSAGDLIAKIVGLWSPGKEIRDAVGAKKPDEMLAGLRQRAKAAELIDNPALAPQGLGEEALAAGAHGLGGSVPFLFGGPAAAAGNALAGIGGGLGAWGLGDKLFPGSTTAKIAGGLLGGLGVGAAIGGAKAAAQGARVANEVRDAEQALAGARNALTDTPGALGSEAIEAQMAARQALGEAGRAAKGATTTAAQTYAQTVDAAKYNFAHTMRMAEMQAAPKLEEQIAKHTTQIGELTRKADETLEAVADQLGKSTTLQQAGEKLQGAARDWLTKTMPAKHAEVWAPVDAAIEAGAPSALPGFAHVLEQINSRAGALEPVAELLRPAVQGKLGKVFDRLAESPAKAKDMEKMLPTGDAQVVAGLPFTWSDSRHLRTLLGEALGNPKIVSDVGEQNLKRLYAAITSDMGATAKAAGAGEAFAEANKVSSRLYELAQGPVAKLVGGTKASLETDNGPGVVASRLLATAGKENTDLAALAEIVPEAVKELGATAIRRGLWKNLSPEAKTTFVAEPNARGIVEAMDRGKTGFTETAEAAIAQAKEAHKAMLEATKARAAAVRDEAIAAAKAARDQARTEASDAVGAVRESQRRQSEQLRLDLARKREALDAAKATHEAAVAKQNALGATPLSAALAENRTVQAILRSDVGQHFGHLLSSAVGGAIGRDMAGAFGGVLGAASPYVVQGLGHMIRHPEALRYPAIGAVGGNALGGGVNGK